LQVVLFLMKPKRINVPSQINAILSKICKKICISEKKMQDNKENLMCLEYEYTL